MSWFNKKRGDVLEASFVVNPETIEKILKVFIARESKVVTASELEQDTTIFSSGLLDSLSFIKLVLFVEQKFRVKISEGINMNAMDNIYRIIKLILSK